MLIRKPMKAIAQARRFSAGLSDGFHGPGIGVSCLSTLRFGELRRGLPGITEKMLAQQLRELERDQLIIRTQYPEMPPRVEYSLSAFGQSLTPVLEALKAWGQENRAKVIQIIEANHLFNPRS